MAKSRRANAILFGFDFQVNAAIILMLENIDEMSSLRLEGDYEDIEIKLNDGQFILAQAKAIEKSSSDFSHVRSNLKKALETLSESAQKAQAKQLILITNSPNPLNEDASKSIFYGEAHRSYSSLPESSKKIISNYLDGLACPLDTDKFMIQILPFETDDDRERYKIVRNRIDDFIGSLDLNISGVGSKLMTIWHEDIFQNGSKKDSNITLDKKEIIWPVVVLVSDIERCDKDLWDDFEPGEYEEITHKYHELISSCCERCDFFIRVLYDYNQYHPVGIKPREKCWNFAKCKWKDYESEFLVCDEDQKAKSQLIQIILYSIVRNRIAIDKIKKGVRLC